MSNLMVGFLSILLFALVVVDAIYCCNSFRPDVKAVKKDKKNRIIIE